MSANSRLTVAIHALCWLELAQELGEPALSSERVAASLDSHPVAVRRALSDLKSAGLVKSGRGPGSGWSLNRPAREITLLEIARAVGEQGRYALHAHPPNRECPVGSGIQPVLSRVYDEIEDLTESVLLGRTVRDVLDEVLASANSKSIDG